MKSSSSPTLAAASPRSRGLGTRAVSLVVVSTSLSMASPVWAADPGRAEALITEANRLRSRGQDIKAFPLMKEAYDLAPSPRTAGQLGLAEMAVGYWLEADRHLDEALAAPGHPWVSKNSAVLEQAQKKVRTHLATFALDGEPMGAEVLANGQSVGKLPLPNLVLAEGRITFDVRAPGHAEESKQVTVAGGTQTSLHFALRTLRTEPPATEKPPTTPPPSPPVANLPPAPPPAAEGDSQGPSRVLPISLAAGAGVALGFAIWQHIAWQGAVDDYEKVDGCYASLPMRGTDTRCQGLYDKVGPHRTLAIVGYSATGLLAAGAGLAFWLGSPSEKTAAAQGPSLTRIAFGSLTAPLSLQLSGSF